MTTNALAGLRALVVEDEAIVAMMIEDMLTGLGCSVAGTAARVEEAAEKANLLDLDIAVLDLNLEGHHTFGVADRLRERGIPFVFATGYGGAGVDERYSSAPTLAKPFTEMQLASALRRALGNGSQPASPG